tara:strand:+ start:3040 stop:3384 length:345 start_codon:yes stop_codon:yes gene_type:complete
MPTVNLTFSNNINVSVQVGDMIYYSPTTLTGTHDTAGTIIELGDVASISGNTIVVNYQVGTVLPTASDFIMFAKDRSANMSSLLGYFAEFRIVNNSKEEAEMYSVSVDVTDSSK